MYPNYPDLDKLDEPKIEFVSPSFQLPKVTLDKGIPYAVSVGPESISDPEKGLVFRYWLAYYINGALYLERSEDDQWIDTFVVFNPSSAIVQLSFAFDQLANPVVIYKTDDGEIIIRFYDSLLAGFTELSLGYGGSPLIAFDYLSEPSNSLSDLIIFYVNNSQQAVTRLQRERFQTEHEVGVSYPDLKLLESGMSSGASYQVVYRYGLPDYTPPNPEPPVPPGIDGRYVYVMNYATQLKVPKTLIDSPKDSHIKVEFNLYGTAGAKEKSGNQLGAYGFPIYCEGAASVIHPANREYNRSIFTNNGVQLRWEKLKAARNFSLSFMYDDAQRLNLYLVINGKTNSFYMPFDFVDGYYYVEIVGLSVIVGNDLGILFTGSIKRGDDVQSVKPGGFFASYNMQPDGFNWRANFTGAYYDVAVTVDGNKTSYSISDSTTELQSSTPAGNDLLISNYRPANWQYVIS